MPVEPIETAGILVVDDDAETRETLVMALPMFGFKRLFEAADGLAGYQYVQQHPDQITVVITDYRMPRMSGLELTRQLAGSKGLPVGILLLTAFDQGNLEQEFLSVGSESALPLALFHKPYSIAALIKVLKEAIPDLRARREAWAGA